MDPRYIPFREVQRKRNGILSRLDRTHVVAVYICVPCLFILAIVPIFMCLDLKGQVINLRQDLERLKRTCGTTCNSNKVDSSASEPVSRSSSVEPPPRNDGDVAPGMSFPDEDELQAWMGDATQAATKVDSFRTHAAGIMGGGEQNDPDLPEINVDPEKIVNRDGDYADDTGLSVMEIKERKNFFKTVKAARSNAIDSTGKSHRNMGLDGTQSKLLPAGFREKIQQKQQLQTDERSLDVLRKRRDVAHGPHKRSARRTQFYKGLEKFAGVPEIRHSGKTRLKRRAKGSGRKKNKRRKNKKKKGSKEKKCERAVHLIPDYIWSDVDIAGVTTGFDVEEGLSSNQFSSIKGKYGEMFPNYLFRISTGKNGIKTNGIYHYWKKDPFMVQQNKHSSAQQKEHSKADQDECITYDVDTGKLKIGKGAAGLYYIYSQITHKASEKFLDTPASNFIRLNETKIAECQTSHTSQDNSTSHLTQSCHTSRAIMLQEYDWLQVGDPYGEKMPSLPRHIMAFKDISFWGLVRIDDDHHHHGRRL